MSTTTTAVTSTSTTNNSLASISAKNDSTAKKRRPRRTTNTKRYNCYNIFFMLERQLLLHSRSVQFDGDEANNGMKHGDPVNVSSLSSDVRRYVDLDLPPLCRRYADLPLSGHSWFIVLLMGRDEKRVHKRSHGLVPFADLARIVAGNYKEIDEETRGFVNEVAERLASHCDLIDAAEKKMAIAGTKKKLGQKEYKVNATHEGNTVGEGKSIVADMVNAKVERLETIRDNDRQNLRHRVYPWTVQSSGSLSSPDHHLRHFMYPSSLMTTLPTPPLPFSYDAEVERLRRELELAVSARIETERKISNLMTLMEVLQARTINTSLSHLQHLHRQHLHRFLALHQQQEELPLDNRFQEVGEFNLHRFSTLHQQQETYGGDGEEEDMLLPPKKCSRRCDSENIAVEASAAADKVGSDSNGIVIEAAAFEGRVDHPASLSSDVHDGSLNRRMMRADRLRAMLPPAAQRGILW